MREVTLGMLASMSNRRNNKANRAAEMREYRMIPALKSLDILRQNVQPLLNNDVDAVVKKYLDVMFLLHVLTFNKHKKLNSITKLLYKLKMLFLIFIKEPLIQLSINSSFSTVITLVTVW